MAADAGDGEESVIVAHISFLDADSDGAGALGPVGYADRVLLTSFPVRLLGLLAVLSLSRCSCSVALVGPPADGTSAGSADVIAIAGPDLVVLEGTRVVLAGGASRALVGEPALSWVQSEGPAVVFSDPSSSSPAFISPLAPARLVFVLEAVAQSLRDTDTIVVDVVDHASLLVAEPATLVPVADRSVGVGDEVSIDERWTGRGDPVVVVRCASETLQGATVVDGRLTMRLRPLVLPCPIVIDDGGIPGAGRAAVTIWPATTVLGAASRADAPVSSDAGVDVAVEVDSETRVFFVDGRAITLLASAGGVRFRAPSSSGRLTLVAETRTGNTSGGLRVVPIVVGAGAGNSAPVIDGGADLRLRPGARFRIAPTVVDDNGDDVTVLVTQVLGDAALQVGGGVGVLQAPATAQTLLFHVVATDGVVDSAIDPVRVVVDPTAENRPPVLSIPTDLYVVPGGDFVVDASSARDPDTGLIASTRIAQDVGDAVLLLDGIIDAATVPLRAGAAGDVYRFVISAVDDEGLEASASLTVHVEEAGPFVDVVRGRADGVGTAARPFASIAAALDTAARHRFAQLRLATGGLGLEGVPDGLGLVGGYVFVDDDYVATDVATVVTLTDAVEIAGASLQRLVIGGATGELHLRRRVTLDDVSLSVPLAVLAGAHVDVNGGVAGGDADFDDAIADAGGRCRGDGAEARAVQQASDVEAAFDAADAGEGVDAVGDVHAAHYVEARRDSAGVDGSAITGGGGGHLLQLQARPAFDAEQRVIEAQARASNLLANHGAIDGAGLGGHGESIARGLSVEARQRAREKRRRCAVGVDIDDDVGAGRDAKRERMGEAQVGADAGAAAHDLVSGDVDAVSGDAAAIVKRECALQMDAGPGRDHDVVDAAHDVEADDAQVDAAFGGAHAITRATTQIDVAAQCRLGHINTATREPRHKQARVGDRHDVDPQASAAAGAAAVGEEVCRRGHGWNSSDAATRPLVVSVQQRRVADHARGAPARAQQRGHAFFEVGTADAGREQAVGARALAHVSERAAGVDVDHAGV